MYFLVQIPICHKELISYCDYCRFELSYAPSVFGVVLLGKDDIVFAFPCVVAIPSQLTCLFVPDLDPRGICASSTSRA